MKNIRYKKYYLYNLKKELLNQKLEEKTKKEEKGKVLVLKMN